MITYIIYSDDSDSGLPPARKIDLAALLKPARRSQNHNEQRSRSGSLVKSDAKLMFPPRTTASSGIVTSKPSSKMAPSHPKQKKRGSNGDADSEQDSSAEDDSREREMALSSPMKGSELRSAKVCYLCIAGNILTLF